MRVDELKMENEYQLRLRDMNYDEKLKDITDKFLQDIDSLNAKNEVSAIKLCLMVSLMIKNVIV